MSIRTFWLIFLKILGLRLIANCLQAIALMQVYATAEYNEGNVGEAILIVLFGLSAYMVVMLTLIFKTNWVINTLGLDKNFAEDRIDLNISSNTVLRMATIVLGGLMIIEIFPALFDDFIGIFNGSIFRDNSEFRFNLTQTILGLVLMILNKPITEFITKKANE